MTVQAERPAAKIDADRLWRDVLALGSITDPGRPYTRRCFTDRFLEGRLWLRQRFDEAGLTVTIDPAANMIGRLEGTEPELPAIVIGSHSDTVPAGGRFDGCLGVLGGLEVVRALQHSGVRLRHPLEVIDFLGEEPSDYGPSCIGSRAMSGWLDDALLASTNGDGETLRAAMVRMGAVDDPTSAGPRGDIAACLELHIEQGRTLEHNRADAGIVTGIVGIERFEVVFEGSPDHTGTTPFALRRDALVAGAEVVAEVERSGRRLSVEDGVYFVATVGRLSVEPNASNVVPSRVTLTVEARSSSEEVLSRFARDLDATTIRIASRTGVDRAVYQPISRSKPSHMSGRLCTILTEAAARIGSSTMPMTSGAGHDAAFMTHIAPTAMVFVPSRNGRSHCPEEWTDPEQCVTGAALLLEAAVSVDRDPVFYAERRALDASPTTYAARAS